MKGFHHHPSGFGEKGLERRDRRNLRRSTSTVQRGEKPFNNKKIRKAFALAIDRKSIVENVTQGGQVPATGLVPWI